MRKPRTENILPTRLEEKSLARQIKAKALSGDMAAAGVLTNLMLIAELRRAGGFVEPNRTLLREQ